MRLLHEIKREKTEWWRDLPRPIDSSWFGDFNIEYHTRIDYEAMNEAITNLNLQYRYFNTTMTTTTNILYNTLSNLRLGATND